MSTHGTAERLGLSLGKLQFQFHVARLERRLLGGSLCSETRLTFRFLLPALAHEVGVRATVARSDVYGGPWLRRATSTALGGVLLFARDQPMFRGRLE